MLQERRDELLYATAIGARGSRLVMLQAPKKGLETDPTSSEPAQAVGQKPTAACSPVSVLIPVRVMKKF